MQWLWYDFNRFCCHEWSQLNEQLNLRLYLLNCIVFFCTINITLFEQNWFLFLCKFMVKLTAESDLVCSFFLYVSNFTVLNLSIKIFLNARLVFKSTLTQEITEKTDCLVNYAEFGFFLQSVLLVDGKKFKNKV